MEFCSLSITEITLKECVPTACSRPSQAISTFPPELLLEIFRHVCEPPQGSLGSLSGRRSQREFAWTESRSNIHNPTPFLLGKICRRWRELVWSAPRLWTYIHLVIMPERAAAQAALLHEYIRRSLALPLTIVFRVMECDDNQVQFSFMDVHKLYQMIFRETYRWDTVDIFVPNRCSVILDRVCMHSPMLRRACVYQRRRDANRMSLWTITYVAPGHEFVHRSPRLEELSIKSIAFSSPPSPYLYLTHLSASMTTILGLRGLLRNSPNLRWCSLHVISPYRNGMGGNLPNTESSTNMPFHMVHLETFIIRSCPWRVVCDILSSIKFLRPFREFRTTGTALMPELFNIIRRRVGPPACSLRVLELGSEWFNTPSNIVAGLGVLLQRTRSLTTLILTFPEHETLDAQRVKTIADLLDPVWPPEPLYNSTSLDFSLMENRVLAPRLQNFELRMEGKGPSIVPILTVLKHRWMFGSSAESSRAGSASTARYRKIVSITLPEVYRAEATQELKDVMKEGMKVEFSANPDLLGLYDFLRQ